MEKKQIAWFIDEFRVAGPGQTRNVTGLYLLIGIFGKKYPVI